MLELWTIVDTYFEAAFAPSDQRLQAALVANTEAGLPAHDVSPLQGKFLELLVRISGAKRVLEIGTLGGYSTIWLALAVGPDGKVTTLEANPAHAAVARENLQRAGLAARVDVIDGKAIDSLPLLQRQGAGPFDFIFIDADKPSNPEYLAWALRLSRPGTVIIGDNVVREGKVVDPDSQDANVRGVRSFVEMIASEPRLSATAIQTVGAKGYDGFVMAVVGG